jgi:hypothetical protein
MSMLTACPCQTLHALVVQLGESQTEWSVAEGLANKEYGNHMRVRSFCCHLRRLLILCLYDFQKYPQSLEQLSWTHVTMLPRLTAAVGTWIKRTWGVCLRWKMMQKKATHSTHQ